jgi:hypothetical protein
MAGVLQDPLFSRAAARRHEVVVTCLRKIGNTRFEINACKYSSRVSSVPTPEANGSVG